MKIMQKAVAISTLAILWIIFITGLPTITEQADFMTILFEVVSAFGTVGLSLGITASLTTVGKILIICTMFIGRVGLLTIAMPLAGGIFMPTRQNIPSRK
jgi:trk system potassium uptake protein TrkH